MYLSGLRQKLTYPGVGSVIVCLICQIFIMGAPNSTPPLMYKHVIQEFHWTFSQATLGFSVAKWVGGAFAILAIGPYLERMGLRAVMITACLLTGLGMTGFLLVHAMWSYYLCFVPMMLGTATAMVGTKILVSRWYTRNLGIATGVALAGGSIGGAWLPLVWTSIAGAAGWRTAEASMGAAILLIVLPCYLLFANEHPTLEQVVPEAFKAPANPGTAERMRQADLTESFGQVLRMPIFWAACVGIMLIQAVDQGMLQHAALYLQTERGLSAKAAAGAISGMFAVGIFSKIFAGWFYDRLSITGVQLWWLSMGAVVVLALGVQAGLDLTIFAIAWGMAHGGLVGEAPVIAKHVFGPRLINRVFPFFIGFLTFGSGLGVFVVSAMVDHFGHYREALLLLLGVSVFSAALLFIVRPLYLERLRNAQLAVDGDDVIGPGGLKPTFAGEVARSGLAKSRHGKATSVNVSR